MTKHRVWRSLISMASLFLGFACGQKGKEDPANVSLLAAKGSLSFEGLPSNPSSESQLAIRLVGEKLRSYRYALIQNSTQCLDVEWSELRPATIPIEADLGTDGLKTLCVIAVVVQDKDEETIPSSFTWVKDSAAPSVSFAAIGSLGPNSVLTESFTIQWAVHDDLSPMKEVKVSLQTAGQCLNEDLSAFDAPCPLPLNPSSLGNDNFSLAIPKNLMNNGQSYQLTVLASDKADNLSGADASIRFDWDASGPIASSSLNATASSQSVSLSWPSEASASSYLVLRRKSAQVSLDGNIPLPYRVGQVLKNEVVIACVTTGNSCTDTDLDPFTWYHYQLYSVDSAENLSSSGPRTFVQTEIQESFRGLTRAYLASPSRLLSFEWQKFSQSAASGYEVFASSSTGSQDFNQPLALGTGEALSYFDSSKSDNLFFIGKQRLTDGRLDKNREELRLRLATGIHHKLAAIGRFQGQDPLTQVFLGSAYAVAVDPYGNVVFGGNPGRINVLCKENLSAYYCKGRNLEKIYTFVGRDGSDDGNDEGLASSTATGEPYGLSFDSYGNLFIADVTNFRIRVVCYAPSAPGICNSKKLAYAYHVAGTGSSVDGLDDSVAKTSGIGSPYGVASDNKGNIYVADNTFRKIRVICVDLNSPNCSGKVAGNSYSLIGTGIAGDALDGIAPLATNLGNIGALALDSRGNIYFSDLTYFRLRAYCLDVTGTGHFCAGKTSGLVYRVSGTGVTGDGADNTLATSSSLGSVNGIVAGNKGNIYLTVNSATGNRLRVLCYNTTDDELCIGKTIGKSYRISGLGTSTDGANNVLGAAVAIGSPRGLAMDRKGNLVFADPTNRRIRLHCILSEALCDGRVPDYHYHLAGVGSSSLGWNFNAFLTPIGLPQGLAEDAYGNIYFADATNFVARVLCYDVTHAGFCFRKQAGTSYVIAGNGVTGNAADNTLALANSIGVITGVEVDSAGNALLADSTNRTIRLVCGTNTDLCAGKVIGSVYRFIGNTTAVDTTDNAVAVSSGLGVPSDISTDNDGNLWIADSQYFRVRLYCRNTSGSCLGKTAGNIYRIVGTGVTGNGVDAALANASALGTLTSLDVDGFNNLIIGDSSNFFVRVYCQNAGGGYCATKSSPQGKVYRALGTGVTGDGISDTAANATAISAMNAVQADARGNIFVAEAGNRRIRVLCLDSSVDYCRGLTSGNSYRFIGSGSAGDASSGVTGASARIDTPSRDSLLFTKTGQHLIYAGGGSPAGLGTIRVFLGFP